MKFSRFHLERLNTRIIILSITNFVGTTIAARNILNWDEDVSNGLGQCDQTLELKVA